MAMLRCVLVALSVAIAASGRWCDAAPAAAAAAAAPPSYLSVLGRHLVYQDEPAFLLGVDQAWQHYGRDFGAGEYAQVRPQLVATLRNVSANGGNAVRMWLHCGGSIGPIVQDDGTVAMAVPVQNVVDDLQDYLEAAQLYGVFVILR